MNYISRNLEKVVSAVTKEYPVVLVTGLERFRQRANTDKKELSATSSNFYTFFNKSVNPAKHPAGLGVYRRNYSKQCTQ